MTGRPYLTLDQIELLLLVEDGLTRRQIAQHLHYSFDCIKDRTKTLRALFGTHTTQHAAHLARTAGLLPESTP